MPVQSEVEVVFAGVAGFASGVFDVEPASVDVELPLVDDVDSVEVVVVDEDDFDLPPRLSVM